MLQTDNGRQVIVVFVCMMVTNPSSFCNRIVTIFSFLATIIDCLFRSFKWDNGRSIINEFGYGKFSNN